MKDITYNLLSVAFIVAVTLTLCLLNHYSGHNWGGDFSLYIHQTKSILTGTVTELAINNNYIVQNSSVHTFSPVLYPWGFPLLLSPVYAIFGINYIAFKAWESVFLAGAVGVMLFTFTHNHRLPAPYGLLLSAIIAFHPLYISATNEILSDIPFLTFSYLGLYLILRLLHNTVRCSWGLSALTGVIMFFAFSIRTEGIGLLFALLAGQLYNLARHKKTMQSNLFIFIFPYTIFLILYGTSFGVLPIGFTSHFSYRNLISWHTSWENIVTYLGWLSKDMFSVPLVPYFIYLVFGLAITGVIYRLKNDLSLVVYFIFLLVMFTIWPFREPRYLFSLYPLLIYFFIQGLLFWYKQSRTKELVKYVGIGILALSLTTHLTSTVKNTLHSIKGGISSPFGPESIESREMFSYIKTNTEKTDIIAFFKPRVMHLYTDRISLALFNNIDELTEKADYYVETKRMGNYFQLPLIGSGTYSHPHLKRTFDNHEFTIYKIRKN